MSADRWAICPRCKLTAEHQKNEKKLKAGAAYGKVDQAQYLEMLSEAEKPVELGETFRENYWVGLDNEGYFTAEYSGSCNTCGLEHKFEHKQQLDLSPIVKNTSAIKRKQKGA